jgi:hypothetical protein
MMQAAGTEVRKLLRLPVVMLILVLSLPTGCGTTKTEQVDDKSPSPQAATAEPGTLIITLPLESTLFLDGNKVQIGQERPIRLSVAPGSHVVSFISPGAEEEFRRIRVESGGTLRLELKSDVADAAESESDGTSESGARSAHLPSNAPSDEPDAENRSGSEERTAETGGGEVAETEEAGPNSAEPADATAPQGAAPEETAEKPSEGSFPMPEVAPPLREPMVVMDNGFYRGDVRDGEPHGYGSFYWKDGDVYTGTWKDGRRHGFGRLEWASGGSYEGEWRNGDRHGPGTIEYPDGGIYEGDWKDDRRDGVGVMTWANGDTYEGEWQDGRQHGVGLFVWADGSWYEGRWKDGKPHGAGVMAYEDGMTYEGRFARGVPNGGWLTTSNGKTYWAKMDEDGDWVDAPLPNERFPETQGTVEVPSGPERAAPGPTDSPATEPEQ